MVAYSHTAIWFLFLAYPPATSAFSTRDECGLLPTSPPRRPQPRLPLLRPSQARAFRPAGRPSRRSGRRPSRALAGLRDRDSRCRVCIPSKFSLSHSLGCHHSSLLERPESRSPPSWIRANSSACAGHGFHEGFRPDRTGDVSSRSDHDLDPRPIREILIIFFSARGLAARGRSIWRCSRFPSSSRRLDLVQILAQILSSCLSLFLVMELWLWDCFVWWTSEPVFFLTV